MYIYTAAHTATYMSTKKKRGPLELNNTRN